LNIFVYPDEGGVYITRVNLTRSLRTSGKIREEYTPPTHERFMVIFDTFWEESHDILNNLGFSTDPFEEGFRHIPV